MNENLVRQAQGRQQKEQDLVGAVPPGSVDEALALAMATGKSNSLVAVIERFNKATQQKEKSYFVVRAGRGGKLNEAATKKGGIALMRSHCVRASWEKPEQIQRLYDGLPTPELKTKFLESRGFDFRVFTAPAGWSIYTYTILFGSGEKWQGEGIANPDNTDKKEWQDATAETRAFSRTVGRGTGEGLLPGDQLAGSGDLDDFNLEAEEGELLSEAEATARVSTPAVADIPTAKVQAALNALSDSEEADPDGSDPFRTPGGGGPSGDAAGPADADGGSPAGGAAGGPGAVERDDPFFAGSQGSNEHDGGHSGPDGGDPPINVSLKELIEMAKAKNIFLLKFVQEEVGLQIERLNQMTDFERSIAASKLQAYPEKVAR